MDHYIRCLATAAILSAVSGTFAQGNDAGQSGGVTLSDVATKPDETAIITSEFLYDVAPFPSCHASTIVETPGGLVAAWFGGTDEGEKDVGIWVSSHQGGRWTPPVEAANGVQHSTLRWPCWNPVLAQQPGGALHLFYKCGPSPSRWWGMWTTSDDHGLTWSWPRRLPDTIDGPVKNKPVLLDDGALLCGSSTEHDGWRLHFEVTRDWGRSWERIGPINDGRQFSAIQPTILQHRSGELQALCRSREGSILSTRSADGGRTWSPLERTPLPNSSAGIDAVTLRDGSHLLVYNHTVRATGQPRDRELLNVAVSEDGSTWQAALVLENEPKAEFSYPAVIQTGDGLVHTTYTWKREKIRHVVIDPAKLQLRPMEGGRWPGLPDAGAANAQP
jgi:alpha-L-rhamnosidase